MGRKKDTAAKVCGNCGTSEGRIVSSRKFNKDLCYSCYQVFVKEGEVVHHELPPKGEVHYDKEGRPICHICGRAVKKLMGHVRQKHDMTAYEYKKEFGLNTTHSIMAESCVEIARQRALENKELVIDKNLLEKGQKTRYQQGSEGRTRENLSLQELKRIRRMNTEVIFRRQPAEK